MSPAENSVLLLLAFVFPSVSCPERVKCSAKLGVALTQRSGPQEKANCSAKQEMEGNNLTEQVGN